MDNNLRTVLDWARFASSQFTIAQREKRIGFGHGTTNAVDEAVWLVTGALGLDPDRFDLFSGARVTPLEALKIESLIHQRLDSGQPLAYLLGEAWLMGQRFLSDNRALVPRSFIAELLEDSLDAFLSDEPSQILDMCTGGGSLAILAAQRFPMASVTGVDISADALALAQDNRALFDFSQRINLVESDLFAKLKGKFDLILCNPPYVNASSMEQLPREYLREPQLALHGGALGMDLIARILEAAPKFLSKQGILVLELGNEAEHFEGQFSHVPVTWLNSSGGDQTVFVISRDELTAS